MTTVLMRYEDRSRKARVLIWVGALLIVGLLGFLIGWKMNGPSASATEAVEPGKVIGMGKEMPEEIAKDVEFKQFWNLWQLLKEKYYEQPVQDKSLFYGAMGGLAASLGDPYTSFFEPKLATEFQQSLAGTFDGIGAEIGLKNNLLQIVAPLPESPAERAGLMSGDVIIKIDKKETTGMTTEQAVTLIRGPKGTKVVLSIIRPSQKKPAFDVEIVREKIQVKSVKWKMLPNQIAYIELTNFNQDTEGLFNQAIDFVQKKEAKGVILDMRNNPGGYLETALVIAGEWVGDQVVVKERRQGKIFEELKGTGRKRLANMPTIVLVNEGSASAAEIVAGAIQDYGKGKVVGKKTFGKGSVQEYQDLSDGSGVKITIAEWLTPKERTINKTGLDPEIVVDRTPEDYEADRDPQLDRAVALLGGAPKGAATSTAIAP